MSLRTRLTIGSVCTLALAICAGLAAAYLVVRGQLRSEIDHSLERRADALVAIAQQAPVPASPLGPATITVPAPALGAAAGYVQFVDASGNVALATGESTRLPTRGAAAVASGRRAGFFSDATVAGTHVRIYVSRVDGQTAAEIARPLTEVDHSLARIRLLFILVSLAAGAGAVAITAVVARSILRPVERLTGDAERIAATGTLGARTDEGRSDELGRLARAFNRMLDALSRSVSAQRQLVADASHELRTPLAAARANLELAELHEGLPPDERRRLLAEASAELRELTALIDDVVELARADAEVPARQDVRLDHLVEEAVATASRRSATAIDADLRPTVVNAAPEAVTRAVANLIDNAVKWSPDGEPVEVTVKDGTVKVCDRGPGIDPADLPHIFDRFYRAPEARTLPGSGLGLAIVRQVAEAHGGTVTAEPGAGGGTQFILRLPPLGNGASGGGGELGPVPARPD
jgi:two-component system, OmpR family, sensor histidine kinase MprB